MLKAQCRLDWDLKTPAAKYGDRAYIHEVYLQEESYQVLNVKIREKAPCASCRERGKVIILKYSRAFSSSSKGLVSKETIFTRPYQLWEREIPPGLDFLSHLKVKKCWEAPVKITALEHRLTRRQRANHRIMKCTPFPTSDQKSRNGWGLIV